MHAARRAGGTCVLRSPATVPFALQALLVSDTSQLDPLVGELPAQPAGACQPPARLACPARAAQGPLGVNPSLPLAPLAPPPTPTTDEFRSVLRATEDLLDQYASLRRRRRDIKALKARGGLLALCGSRGSRCMAAAACCLTLPWFPVTLLRALSGRR